MKNIYFIIAALLILLMLTLPLISLYSPSEKPKSAGSVPEKEVSLTDTVVIKNTDTGKTETVALDDYLFGVVACEMPALYENEALKAQAVAAYTFLLYRSSENNDKDYDITTAAGTDQGFITREAAAIKWGDNADAYTKKIDEAITSVKNEYVSYEGSPILAAFHAISSGKTESSSTVWGLDLPYLTERESIGDLLASDYQTEVSIPAADFKKAFEGKCTLSDSAADYISDIARSNSGGIISAKIGDKEFSGSEIRSILSLRSANFEIKTDGDNLIFTVFGYGHGVGMSQNGANYMAQQGNTYKEILLWYYTGCEIKKN